MKTDKFIDFQGQKVLVTGASSGIGRAISLELSRCGAEVVLIGRDKDQLENTASEMEGGSAYHIILLDLNEPSSIRDKIRELSEKIGRIYGICHCAGVVETRPLSACKISGVQWMLNVNLISGIELARVVCRRDIMEESGGSIVFISSIYALIGMPGQIGYSATKGAVSAAVRAMAVELARRRIRVNSISPGLVRTDMTEEAFSMLSKGQVKDLEDAYPLGTGKPDDVARAAIFLLAPQNRWITGVDLVIDGGYTAK